MNNEKELSPQESLQLIQSMIDKTKGDFSDDSFYFLFWGWMVFLVTIIQFLLKVVFNYQYHYAVWWIMPIGGIVSGIYGIAQAKNKRVKTFVNEATNYLWLGIGLAFITLIFININSGNWQNALSYFILLYAIGTFVTGQLIQFKPLIIGGSFNFILAIICVKFSYDLQLLIGALAILTSYIIPGHLLRMRYHKHHQ